MVDICPFKAQERMNDVCKNNYFSPRTKQSYTKLSKLEDTNKKGCPRFPEQPLLFSFYTSVLIFNSTYTYAVPIRFGIWYGRRRYVLVFFRRSGIFGH